MREVLISSECYQYVKKHSKQIEKKFKYCLQILIEHRVIHSKFVKKLVGTSFYELRISVSNEHRIILFTIDHENLVEARRIILLNCFLKKSSNDYIKAITTAQKLVEKYKV